MKTFTLAAAVVIQLGTGALCPLLAQAPSVVEQRQATMKQQGAALAAVKRFIDGSGNRGDAIRGARELLRLSGTVASLFPAGTSSLDLSGTTRAKPLIWTDRATFERIAQSLTPAAEALLSTVQSGDAAVVREQLALTAQVCNTCHLTYREPK